MIYVNNGKKTSTMYFENLKAFFMHLGQNLDPIKMLGILSNAQSDKMRKLNFELSYSYLMHKMTK